MIIDKSILNPAVTTATETQNTTETVTEEEKYTTNALCDVYNAVKEILSTMLTDENDAGSGKLFPTIKMDNGQLSRIKNSKHNEEYGIAFPAIFIHYINVHYLVSQSRIGQGRATMRIHFILNRLNNSDEECELEGYRIFQRINDTLLDKKSSYPALSERFRLMYFDQPESFDDGLQPFWIDYEVYFTQYSSSRYRYYKTKYLVAPPFTNHSDQLEENNTEKHSNHTTPTYDDSSKIEDITE